MSCLDPNVIADLVEGRLDPALRGEIDAHVAACRECRELVGELVRDDGQRIAELEPGAQLGRYVVGERLGAGAMGAVYAARDLELDREVAIKVLRADTIDPIAMHERLLREARTMAKISDPGVVAVYDVGFAGARVFVAMELVDGVTLREWMRRARTQREICDAFVQAGRGLAAVHAAGLVHGDFKPDNVLVRADGRVQVTDFGLARLVAPTGADPMQSSVGGTPAYMAPEQAAGRCEARSDQFGFCASLYEALAGARAPAPLTAPRWLRSLLERGLAPEPAARFPSMDAVVAELTRDRRRARRWLALGVAAVVVGAASVAAVIAVQRGRIAACSASADRLAGIWDRARSEAIHRAFLATGVPYAEDEWRGVDRVLSVRAGSWIAAATRACEATAREAPATTDAGCLADQRDELRAMTDRFLAADALLVRSAVGASLVIGTADDCMAHRIGGELPALPRDAASRAKALRVFGDLVLVHEYADAFDVQQAEQLASKVVAETKDLGYEPMYVRALLDAQIVEINAGELERAQADADQALVAAERAGDDRGRLSAMVAQCGLGEATGDLDKSEAWEARATAVLHRIGDDDDILLASGLADTRCELASLKGDAAATDKACHAEIALVERLEGPSSLNAAWAYVTAGNAMLEAPPTDRVADLGLLRRAIDIEEAQLGAKHPRVGSDLVELARGEVLAGQHELAVRDAARAVQILELAAPRSESLASGEVTLAKVQLANGDAAAALPIAGSAVELLGAISATPKIQYEGYATLLDVQLAQHAYSDALATLARQEALLHRWFPADSAAWAPYYSRLAHADRGSNRIAEAVAAFERAIASDTATDAADDRMSLADMLWDAQRDRTRALDLARRAAGDRAADAETHERARTWLAAHERSR